MSDSISDIVAPQLPTLRRFSRALNGSQQRGDAYVVTLLEMLIADRCAFRRDLPPKLALFQLYMRVWNAVPINGESDPAMEDIGAADRQIETLTPRPRQAFLLAALENFATSEIATVLECQLLLTIQRVSVNNNLVRIGWPLTCSPFALQATPTVYPPVLWTTLAVPYLMMDDQNCTIIPAAQAMQYFRVTLP